MAQAFADMWIFIFDSDHMRNLLVQGKVIKPTMACLCREYMKMCSMAEGVLSDIEELPELLVVHGAVHRVRQFCRCVMRLLGVDVPGVSTSARDVTFYTEYRGSAMYEKRLKGLLSKAGSFWRQASDEVIRVGSEAELRAPELKRLRNLAQESFKTQANSLPAVAVLEEVLRLHGELSGHVRDVDLEATTDALVSILKSATASILKEEVKCIPAGLVDAILAGIGKFSDIPGIATCGSSLQAWVAKHRSTVALTDLMAAMEQSTREAIDYAQIMTLLPCHPQSAGQGWVFVESRCKVQSFCM